MKIIRAISFLLAISACAATVNHTTPSKKPEVTIAGESVDTVKASLINEMVQKGYYITSDSQYLLVMDRPVDSTFGAVLYGSRYDGQPNARISFTLIAINDATRVIADIAVITNPGSGLERRTSLNNSQESLNVQKMLDSLQNN